MNIGPFKKTISRESLRNTTFCSFWFTLNLARVKINKSLTFKILYLDWVGIRFYYNFYKEIPKDKEQILLYLSLVYLPIWSDFGFDSLRNVRYNPYNDLDPRLTETLNVSVKKGKMCIFFLVLNEGKKILKNPIYQQNLSKTLYNCRNSALRLAKSCLAKVQKI